MDDASNEVPHACYAFLRAVDEEQTLVALSFSGQGQHLTIPWLEETVTVVSTHMDRSGPVDPATRSLRGKKGVVI